MSAMHGFCIESEVRFFLRASHFFYHRHHHSIRILFEWFRKKVWLKFIFWID